MGQNNHRNKEQMSTLLDAVFSDYYREMGGQALDLAEVKAFCSSFLSPDAQAFLIKSLGTCTDKEIAHLDEIVSERLDPSE